MANRQRKLSIFDYALEHNPEYYQLSSKKSKTKYFALRLAAFFRLENLLENAASDYNRSDDEDVSAETLEEIKSTKLIMPLSPRSKKLDKIKRYKAF
jgi:hypothetical protein